MENGARLNKIISIHPAPFVANKKTILILPLAPFPGVSLSQNSHMLEALLKGLAIGLYLSVSVGPLIFAVIKTSLNYGHKAGYAFVAGVSASDILMVLVGNLAAGFVQNVLRYEKQIAIGGGILLITMGLLTIILKKEPKVGDDHGIAAKLDHKGYFTISLQGFFMNLLNPGPIILWLSWCTYFAPIMTLNERIVLFSTCLIFVLAADITKVVLAGKLRDKLTQKTLHKINIISAIILIVFGVFILARVIFYPGKFGH
ncbi:MAG: LysE family transporter [Chitinophagaceae bacterium]